MFEDFRFLVNWSMTKFVHTYLVKFILFFVVLSAVVKLFKTVEDLRGLGLQTAALSKRSLITSKTVIYYFLNPSFVA